MTDGANFKTEMYTDRQIKDKKKKKEKKQTKDRQTQIKTDFY